MRFALTDDQQELKNGFREFLAGTHPAERVRELWDSGTGRSPALWSELAELGVVGLTVPESDGGLGLGEIELVALLEEAGYALLAEPLLSTTAVAAPLFREVDAATEWLPRIASGEAIVAVGLAHSTFVGDAHVANVLVLQQDDELYAVEPTGVQLTEQPSIDRARRLFTVTWDPSRATGLEATPGAIEAAFDRAALAASAELLGVARRLIDMSVDYAREREQFGQPIGSFQAIKHLLADALVRLEFARPVVYRAAASTATSSPVRGRDVSMAKAASSDAAQLAAGVALQVHGAIGYTWEHDLHFWLAHAEALAHAWGDAAWHRCRVGDYLLTPASPA
jgi:alkylation response protein AidB-like acyl-CoA dehydrogenase